MKKVIPIDAERVMSAANISERHKSIIWNCLRITVCEFISFDEMISLIGRAVDSCYDSVNNVYHAELIDLSIRSAVVQGYTNIELPSDISDRFALLYYTTLFDLIKSAISTSQLTYITRAVSMLIGAPFMDEHATV